VRNAVLRTGARRYLVAGACRTGEAIVGCEVAILGEELEHALLILSIEVLIERTLPDAFGEQLRDMAAGVIDHLPLLNRLAAVEVVRLHERRARGIDLDFERDAELVAVIQHVGVNGRQARGTGVEVEAFVEGACLLSTVGEVDASAATDGPVAAADTVACFENC